MHRQPAWATPNIDQTQNGLMQRKMMRSIVGTRRLAHEDGLEDWAEWIYRSTQAAKLVMIDLSVPDWVEEIHRRQFRWAGRPARLDDNRWTREVLLWSVAGSRKRGRPKKRWTDHLNQFFKQGPQATNEFWLELAMDERSWSLLEDDYVNFCLGQLDEP